MWKFLGPKSECGDSIYWSNNKIIDRWILNFWVSKVQAPHEDSLVALNCVPAPQSSPAMGRAAFSATGPAAKPSHESHKVIRGHLDLGRLIWIVHHSWPKIGRRLISRRGSGARPRRLSILPSLSSSYSTSRRRGGNWLLGVDSAGASSPPVADPAPEMGRGCGVGGPCILPILLP